MGGTSGSCWCDLGWGGLCSWSQGWYEPPQEAEGLPGTVCQGCCSRCPAVRHRRNARHVAMTKAAMTVFNWKPAGMLGLSSISSFDPSLPPVPACAQPPESSHQVLGVEQSQALGLGIAFPLPRMHAQAAQALEVPVSHPRDKRRPCASLFLSSTRHLLAWLVVQLGSWLMGSL